MGQAREVSGMEPVGIDPNQLRFQESCKPNSVCVPLGTERIICLRGHYPKLVPPKRNRSGPLRSFLFGLAPDEVFRAPAIALGAVGSYPTFSPLPGPF